MLATTFWLVGHLGIKFGNRSVFSTKAKDSRNRREPERCFRGLSADRARVLPGFCNRCRRRLLLSFFLYFFIFFYFAFLLLSKDTYEVKRKAAAVAPVQFFFLPFELWCCPPATGVVRVYGTGGKVLRQSVWGSISGGIDREETQGREQCFCTV